MKKMPPEQKILEAFSAIADGRVTMKEQEAEIQSSDRQKTYTVAWQGSVYASDDSATFWQGYPGYPVLAVLLLQGRLPYDAAAAEKLKGIAWKQLNDAHRRNYAAAAQEVLAGLQAQGMDTADIIAAAKSANQALAQLDITVKRLTKRKK